MDKRIHRLSQKEVKILLTGLVLLLFFITVNQAAKIEVRVKAEISSVHLWPNAESQIIGRVHLGTILNVEYKRGKWYKVQLPPDEKGIIKSGYIHQSFVEDAKKEAKEKKEEVSEILIIEEEKPRYKGELISIKFRDADIRDVIEYLCDIGGLNVVFDPGVRGKVTCDFEDIPWDQALDVILKTHKLGKVLEGKVIRTGKVDVLIKKK